MNKSVKLLFCLVFCCFFMTGCVDMNASLTIKKDRSADVNVKTLVEKSAYPMMRKEIDKMKKSYSGSKIVNIEKGKRVGISVTTHTPDINKVQISGFPIAFKPNNIKYLNIKKGFFKDVFVFDNTVDFSDKKKNSQENEYMDYLAGNYMEDSHFNFTMNLPVKADDSNAGEVNNGGKTLKWVLLYGEKNKLYAKFTLLNWTNIVLTSIAGVLLIILSILGIIYRKPLAEKFKNADYKLITKKILVTGSVIAGLCLIGWGIYAGYSYYQAKINNVALYPIYENGKWGYIDETGKVVVKPQYDNVDLPYKGLLIGYKINNTTSKIDRNNINKELKMLFWDFFYSEDSFDGKNTHDNSLLMFSNPDLYQEVGELSIIDVNRQKTNSLNYLNELNPIVVNRNKFSEENEHEKWGFVDKQYNCVIVPQFTQIMPFSEGLASVSQNGKWGVINQSGEFLVKPKFDYIYKFHGGMARVNQDKWRKCSYINTNGELINKDGFEYCHAFSEGLAPVVKIGGKWGYIDKKGNWSIQPNFSVANNFKNGKAFVCLNDKCGFINKKGHYFLDTEYSQIIEHNENNTYLANGKNGWVVLDKDLNQKAFIEKADYTVKTVFKLYLVGTFLEKQDLYQFCYINANGKKLYCFKLP